MKGSVIGMYTFFNIPTEEQLTFIIKAFTLMIFYSPFLFFKTHCKQSLCFVTFLQWICSIGGISISLGQWLIVDENLRAGARLPTLPGKSAS